MKALQLAIALGSCLVCMPALAQEEESSPWSFDVAVVSDYVFRGVSQSDEDPTVQAGFRWTHGSGFYAGGWASGVDFGDAIDADVEVDGFVGYGWTMGEEWAGDVQVIRYFYPGTEDDVDLDYNEVIGVLTYKDNANLTVGWSNDVFNLDESGLFVGVGGSIPLPEDYSVDLGGGYYGFDNDIFEGDDDSYLYWTIGLSKSFGRLDTSIKYYDTDDNGEQLFGGKIADQRLVLTLGMSF